VTGLSGHPPRGALVSRTFPGKDVRVDVFRAFADGEKTIRSRSRRGSRDRRTPVGEIHAARHGVPVTPCGIELDKLYEFGRSRFPFEHFPLGSRCPTCNDAAGRPFE
jgi:hypothetical protein